MRSSLTPTIKRVEGMIEYVRENLDDGEYNLFLDLLVPEPEPVAKPTKKTRKKRATKSAHQQSLSSAIQKVGKGRVGDSYEARCQYQYSDDSPINPGQSCNMEESFAVHDPTMGYAGYHEFQSGKSAAASGD